MNQVNSAKPGQHFTLPKGNYDLYGTWMIKAPNVSVDLGGSTVRLFPSPGASSNISVQSAGFEIYNGTIAKGVVFVRSLAPKTHVHDITTASVDYKTDEGVHEGVFMGDTGSDDALLENIQAGYVGSVAVYFTGDRMTIRNSSFAGSYGEYDIREEIDGKGKLPVGALIDHVTGDNHINAYGKSVIGIRMGSATIQNCTINGYINIGQGKGDATTKVGSNVPQAIVKNNHFTDTRFPQLTIVKGVVAQVIGNTFDTWPKTLSINLDGPSTVTLTGNIRHLMTPGSAYDKRLVAATADPALTWTETGTIVK